MTITATALDDIHRHIAAASDHHETGGILLGHERPTGIAITIAGDPGPDAQHAPTRFRRDLTHAQHLADDAYHHRRAIWIGEWHTHPQGPDRPSPLDVATYRGFLADPELDFEIFVALILSPTPSPATTCHVQEPSHMAHTWVVHAWAVGTQSTASTPLHVTPDPLTD